MKQVTILAVAGLALLGCPTAGHAATKLLWRTPASGAIIVPNAQGKLVQLSKIDVSAYDRIRLVAIARRPTNVPLNTGFGAPFRLELHIGEGTDDLGLLENGAFPLNPSSGSGEAPAHSERTTAVFDNPVLTTLLVDAIGPTSGNQQTTVDIYVYGDTISGTAGP